MKNKSKVLISMITLIIIMSFTFGCTQEAENPDKDNENTSLERVDENISAGFINDKYIEDDKMIIEFGYVKGNDTAYDGNLVLEVKDSDLFDELELLDHYMITYDNDNNLLSMESNEVVKELMEKEANVEDDEPVEVEDEVEEENQEFEVISSTENVDTEGLTLLDTYSMDIYGDEEEEKIEMYVDAEKDDEGNIMWDDGQNWKMIVQGNDYSFILFEDYLQLSSMDFFVYTIDEDFYISTVDSGTANLTMKEYKYNADNETFEKTIKSNTSGNVNMVYKSTSGL